MKEQTLTYRVIRSVIIGVIVSLVVLVTGVGCARPIHPTTVVATHASYDPSDTTGKPTSGILSIQPSGGGRLVSLNVRGRYNSLIDSYGSEFQPPLKHDDGLTCDQEHCSFVRAYYVKYLQMVQWQRNGRPPTKKGLIKRIIGS